MAGKLFKSAAINLGLLAAAAVLIELGCAATFHFFQDRFTFYQTADYLLQEDRLERAARAFDPELGWLRRYDTPFGERPRPVDYNRPLLSTFGDSFTHGDQVEHNETFQTRLARRLQADVFNFGVGGYGTDQALLRFRRDFPQVQTPLVAMGLITENINRIVNVYRRFYWPKTALSIPKPRFGWDGPQMRLLPNPMQSAAEIPRLRDPAYVQTLGANDYWFNRDRYPLLKFPYTAILFNRQLWRELWAGQGTEALSDIDPRPWEDLWDDDEARGLMFAILGTFVAEAQAQKAQPLILILPRRREVERLLSGRPNTGVELILEQCRREGWLCFDGVSALAAKVHSPDDLNQLYHHHLSARGNAVLARQLYQWLAAEQLLTLD